MPYLQVYNAIHQNSLSHELSTSTVGFYDQGRGSTSDEAHRLAAESLELHFALATVYA